MKLSDLLIFNPIIVQCHDNPDADAIASGYALYSYFKDMGKNVRFIYSGRGKVSKSNLLMLIEYLEIGEVMEYVPDFDSFKSGFGDAFPGLLITADCQYGAGNVTKFPAKYIAIIDHHQVEISDVELSEIVSELGSCSTLVWKMLRDEQIELNNIRLTTALYFGLYTDTNSMSEVFNPYDRDMRDLIPYEKSVIQLLKNSNFSLSEFEIAGNAMNRCRYNEKYRFAYIKAEQCDPNILGVISDFLLQVAEVEICVVFNEWPAGYKLSARSCVKEIHADDMASFITEGVGSGGGHMEKAGGFVRRDLYEEKYGDKSFGDFLDMKMKQYFESCTVIYAKDYVIEYDGMKEYVKKDVPRGYVRAAEVLPVGTPITVRTLEGDADMVVEEDTIIMIGIKGEVYPATYEKFINSYEIKDVKYSEYDLIRKPEYLPTVHNRLDGAVIEITDYAKICIAKGGTHIFAKQSDKRLKIFTQWNEECYYFGKIGDYIAVRCDDLHDVYIVEKDIFAETYEEK